MTITGFIPGYFLNSYPNSWGRFCTSARRVLFRNNRRNIWFKILRFSDYWQELSWQKVPN